VALRKYCSPSLAVKICHLAADIIEDLHMKDEEINSDPQEFTPAALPVAPPPQLAQTLDWDGLAECTGYLPLWLG